MRCWCRGGAWALLVTTGMGSLTVQAWVLPLAAASRRVFLQVGGGTANASNAVINAVSLAVPLTAAQIGNGTAQAMTSNSAQSASPYDGFVVCAPPSQVYVGGYYQSSNAADPASAKLQVTSPTNLTTATGSILAFSQISWSSTANGNATADIPAGTFNGGTLLLYTLPKNNWVENCHSFSYANTTLAAAGTYSGRVSYTLSAP